MKKSITVCDVVECKDSEHKARHFSFFKERKMDAAGSSENWNYGFDLCELHQAVLLQRLLELLEMVQKKELLDILKLMNVKLDPE